MRWAMRRLERSATRLLFGATIALGVASAAAAAPIPPDAAHGGPIAPADIMTLQDMRDAQISPDGRSVLFTVQRQISTFGAEHAAIWRVATDGRTPAHELLAGTRADTNPRWSPDGRSIAFLSKRHDLPTERNPRTGRAPDASSRQLWLIPAAGGKPVPLTTLTKDVSDFAWSPDGRRIALLSADPDSAADKADRDAKRDWVEVDHDRHTTRVWMLDVATRGIRSISPAGIDVDALDWAPDGSRLALRVTDSTSINDAFYHARIVLFDPASGTIGATVLDHAAEGPKWSPDGRTILAEQILTPGFIGTAPRLYDVPTKTVTAIADGYPGLISQVKWTADGHGILALSFEATRSRLVRIDPHAGGVTLVAQLDGEAADFTQSKDGRRVAIALSSPDRPADVWTLVDGKPRVLTRINPQVATWRLGTVREISWHNHVDGHVVYGVLVTPPGYVAGTPLRMVVQVHGGPEWAWWSGWLGSWHEWAQMLATHGYVVLLPNPRGSDGQGLAYARAVMGDWGGMDYQDVLDGVDLMVAQKIADPALLGIAGWSYGGFMAAWAITHGSRFKAAVAGAAPSDLVPFARITDTPDFPLGDLGDPVAHLATYDRESTARMLQEVHTPLLVLHGDADTRVPVTLGLELYRGLRLLGRPVEMVRYPREPHWFHEPAHQQDVQRRVLAWFDQYLAAKPPTADTSGPGVWGPRPQRVQGGALALPPAPSKPPNRRS